MGGRALATGAFIALVATVIGTWSPPAPAQESIPQAVHRIDGTLRELVRQSREMDRKLEELDRKLQELDRTSRELSRRLQALERAGAVAALGSERPARELRRSGERIQDCTECPELLVVPAGSFAMGSPPGEEGRDDDEGPVQPVTIAVPFAVGVYEVTFAEWDACRRGGGCRRTPGDIGWGRGTRPVIDVSWEDAQQYVRWLSRKTGKRYRLLSESEWEYVARAGTQTRYWWGNSVDRGRANCAGCGSRWDRKQTAPVGSFSANAFGLRDVHANVWEWVEDCWHESYAGAPRNRRAWTRSGDCGRRVLRGGSWKNSPAFVRSSSRIWYSTGYRDNNVGFRVARTLD